MNNLIKCPHCNKDVEISQAFRHQIEEQILSLEKEKHKIELEEAKKLALLDAQKKVKEEIDLKLKNATNETEELREEKKKLMEQLLDMNKTIREMRDSQEKQAFENEKKLSEEREKMKEEIAKFESEKAKLKELEYEKKIADMQKLLEDAQRKATQGSQQLQGEVLELDLENTLRVTFPHDEILPVPKGIEGGDMWQKVRNKMGNVAGSILWETKRTKAWSNSWLAKLREDTRNANADIAIIVSEVLPDDIKHFGFVSGVWVCSYEHAIRLATVLRLSLLQVAIAKSSANRRDEELQQIYDYITSQSFRHKFEAHFESVKELKDDLDAEKRSMERIWKKREIQISRLDRSASQMFGEIQGIIGASMPSIKALDMGETSQDSSQELLEF